MPVGERRLRIGSMSSQRFEKLEKQMLLSSGQSAIRPGCFHRLTAVHADCFVKSPGATIVQVRRTVSGDSPEGRRSELRAAGLSFRDSVRKGCAHVVQEQVGVRADPERRHTGGCWQIVRWAVAHRASEIFEERRSAAELCFIERRTLRRRQTFQEAHDCAICAAEISTEPLGSSGNIGVLNPSSIVNAALTASSIVRRSAFQPNRPRPSRPLIPSPSASSGSAPASIA
jgi:hypothetical protein